MKHAVEKDFNEIKEAFARHRDIFPHIRTDYIMRKIKSGNVIFQYGTIIIYRVYKRKTILGEVSARKGDAIIHQILSTQGNGSIVVQEFFDFVKTSVYLTVRADNKKARDFYERHNMKAIGDINWADGKIEGKVYKIPFDKD